MTNAEHFTTPVGQPELPLGEPVEAPRPQLELIQGGVNSEVETEVNINDEIRSHLHRLNNEVPESLERAKAIMGKFAELDSHTQAALRSGGKIEGKQIEAEVADELHEVAETGINYFRLSDTQRKLKEVAVRANTVSELPNELSNQLLHGRAVDEVDNNELRDFILKQSQMLLLDKAIATELTAEQTQAPYDRRPGEVGGVKTKAGQLEHLKPIVGNELRDRSARTSHPTPAQQKQKEFGDVVKIDDVGRAHRHDGKFLTNQELSTVMNFADQIRDGLADRNEPGKAPVNNPPSTEWTQNRPYDFDGTEVIPQARRARMNREDRMRAIGPVDPLSSAWTNPTLHGDVWGETTLHGGDWSDTTYNYSVFNRVKNKFAEAKAKLAILMLDAKDQITSKENRKRNKIIAGVVGAIAIGAAVYLESRGHSTTNGVGRRSAQEHIATHLKHHGGAHNVFQEVNLKPGTGDSIWHEEELHHPNATEHQIYERVQRDLKANHLTWARAHHIAGKFKITR